MDMQNLMSSHLVIVEILSEQEMDQLCHFSHGYDSEPIL